MCYYNNISDTESDDSMPELISDSESYDLNIIINAKKVIEEATILNDIIDKLQNYIEYLKELKTTGYELTCSVDNNGIGVLIKITDS